MKSDGCDTDDFLRLRNEGPGDLNVLISSRSVGRSLTTAFSVSSSPKISSSFSAELGRSWSVKSLELAPGHNSDPAGSGLRDGLRNH